MSSRCSSTLSDDMPPAPGEDISEEFPFAGISDNSCWEEKGEEGEEVEEETPGAAAGTISQQAHEQDALLT